MADEGGPAVPSSRKIVDKESSRKKRKRNQKSTVKSKRIRYDSNDSSFSSDSEHVSKHRKKGRKKVRRSRSRSRDKLYGSERGAMKKRKTKKRKEKKKKKKSTKEKSRIRDASVDSYSSPSRSECVKGTKRRRRKRSPSCSTCRSGSSSPEGLRKGRSFKSSKFDEEKETRRRGKYRSPSFSSSGGSRNSSQSSSIERIGEVSRRRRSQVVEKGYDSDSGGQDGRVDITQDSADFQYCRSNDRFDGLNEREGKVTPEDTSQRFVGEDSYAEAEEKGSGSTYAENLKDAYEGNGVQYVHGVDDDVVPSIRLKSIVVVPAGADNDKVDNLEVILRQKALDNLKKFRRQTSSSVKSPANKKALLMETSDERGEEKIQEDHSRENVSDVSKKNLTMPMVDKDSTQDESFQLLSGGKPAEKPLSPMVNVTTTREGNSEGSVTKHPDISIQPQITSNKTPLRPDFVVCKFKEPLDRLREEQVKHNENLSMSSSVGREILDSGDTKQIHITESEIKLTQASVSVLCSIPDQDTGPNSNNEAKGEPRMDSELEKKTMSVMRGGELVQVSYKVYIPKKSPALARRQLQR